MYKKVKPKTTDILPTRMMLIHIKGTIKNSNGNSASHLEKCISSNGEFVSVGIIPSLI